LGRGLETIEVETAPHLGDNFGKIPESETVLVVKTSCISLSILSLNIQNFLFDYVYRDKSLFL